MLDKDDGSLWSCEQAIVVSTWADIQMEMDKAPPSFPDWLGDQKDEDVAEQLGVSIVTVQFWRIGRNRPNLKHALKLAEISELALEDMLQ